MQIRSKVLGYLIMATVLTAAEFRQFSKIGDSETDSELDNYISIASNHVSRICATPYDDLPDDPGVKQAVKVLVLNWINNKSFPSKSPAIKAQIISYLGAVIDTQKQTIYQRDPPV